VREWTYFGQERDPDKRPQGTQEPEGDAPEGRQASSARPGPHRQRVSAIVDEMLRARERDPGHRDRRDGLPDDEIPF
jgi:hypothetical protein